MVASVVEREGWGTRVKILTCPDNPSDAVWLKELHSRAGEFDVAVSNNPWVLQIMRDAGIATYETGLFRREELEGVKIRKMMREGDERWKERVPEPVDRLIGKSASQLVS